MPTDLHDVQVKMADFTEDELPATLHEPQQMDDSIDMALMSFNNSIASAEQSLERGLSVASSSMTSDKLHGSAGSMETMTHRGFNDCPGTVNMEMPSNVAIINGSSGEESEPVITKMTFEKVNKYNAFSGMLNAHSKFHHSTHGRHEHMKLGPWRTRKAGHQKPIIKGLWKGDPGPWDGTSHSESILDRKLHVAKDQANMKDKYVPSLQFKHRDEVQEKWIDQNSKFSALFHLDNNLTLQLKAARDMAGLMNDGAPPQDPHLVALIEKQKRLGRHFWVKALPNTSSKWANQIARMEAAVNQEDFNADGRLQGGPCEYDHRVLKKGGKPFQTNFHLPSSGTGGLNIDGTKTRLLVETESESTEAAKAKIWARAKLVDEAARAHQMKKRIEQMRAPSTAGSQRFEEGFQSEIGQQSRAGTRADTRRDTGRYSRANSRNFNSRANSGGFSFSLSASRPRSRSTTISRPVSRIMSSRPGSRIASSKTKS